MQWLAYILVGVYSVDIILLFLFGMHLYLMIYLYRKNKNRCISSCDKAYAPFDLKHTPLCETPFVTLQLPIYNEYYVVDRLIESAVEMNWPKDRLEIQVLDDSTDETVEKIRNLVDIYRRRGVDIKHIHRLNRKGHKAGALKEGMDVASGEFIAIFDSDFIPHKDFLIRTVPCFDDPEIGMVQTRWGHINEDYSILTRAQSFGIDGHFMIEQVARNASNLWMNFNGTGGIWRKRCIVESGNWQGDTLTEDFDLSYRAELAGWKFRYFQDIVNPAEIPATISAYKSQQFRWCKGSIQTAVKLIPRILQSDFHWKIKGEALTHLLNYSVHPLMAINILSTLPLLLMDRWAGISIYDSSMMLLFFAATVLSIGTFAPFMFYIYSQKELHHDWKKKIVWLPVLMMIGTGITLVNTRAWLEAVLGISSSFKRTPKYSIEGKGGHIPDFFKYRIPLDKTVILEFVMGIYCLVCIYWAFLVQKPFVIPFMMIYALGFFYVSVQSLMESTGFLARHRLSVIVEKQA